MSHTPGPWKVREDGPFTNGDSQYSQYEIEPNVCSVFYVNDTGRANAQLIAAAPELLEALRFIVTNSAPGSVNTICRADLDRAKQAIAKAEGR